MAERVDTRVERWKRRCGWRGPAGGQNCTSAGRVVGGWTPSTRTTRSGWSRPRPRTSPTATSCGRASSGRAASSTRTRWATSTTSPGGSSPRAAACWSW